MLLLGSKLTFKNLSLNFILQKYKDLTKTPADWGPGPLGDHGPDIEPPDYVICSPDIYRPETGIALLTANLYIPNLKTLINLEVGHI